MLMIEAIVRAIQTDEEDPAKISCALLNTYENANTMERVILNEFCISLCGYSFETLLEQCEREEF